MACGFSELGEDVAHDPSVHIRQSEFAPLVFKGKPLVIESELVKNSRVKIVNVHRFFHRAESEFICGSISDARSDSATGHPHRKGVLVMIPSRVGGLA